MLEFNHKSNKLDIVFSFKIYIQVNFSTNLNTKSTYQYSSMYYQKKNPPI